MPTGGEWMGSGERDGSLQCGAACSTESPAAMCSQACCRQRKLKCADGASQSGRTVNVFLHGPTETAADPDAFVPVVVSLNAAAGRGR